MEAVFDSILSKIRVEDILSSMETTLSSWGENSKEKRLGIIEIRKLTKMISKLPDEGQNILTGNYVFNLSEEGIEIFYGISDVKEKQQFFERMLTRHLGLEENCRISDSSMEKACRRNISKMMKEAEKYTWRGALRTIGNAVAAVLLIGIISFVTAMGVNAEFRENVVNWFIESTRQYTLFHINGSNDGAPSLGSYKPTFIPERYHLYSYDVVTGFATYTYSDANGDLLDVSICMPEANAYLNTENMTKESIEINGSSGYLYHDGTHGSLATSIDGYALYVTGKASKEEFIRIAEGVVRQ